MKIWVVPRCRDYCGCEGKSEALEGVSSFDEKEGACGLSRVSLPSRPLSSPVFVFYFILPLFRAVPEYPLWEGELRQKNTLAWVSPVSEIEMAVRFCDTENDAVVGFVVSPLLQRHEIMCSPRPFISLPVFKNHVQVLAALCTTAVLPYISRLLCVVVELHPWSFDPPPLCLSSANESSPWVREYHATLRLETEGNRLESCTVLMVCDHDQSPRHADEFRLPE